MHYALLSMVAFALLGTVLGDLDGWSWRGDWSGGRVWPGQASALAGGLASQMALVNSQLPPPPPVPTPVPTQPPAVATIVSSSKPTTQSSATYNPTTESSRVVDGNKDTAWSSNSCSHTDDDQGEWWQVDLQEMMTIEKVDIVNYNDDGDLTGAEVRISDTPLTGGAGAAMQGTKCGAVTTGGINVTH